MEAAALDGVGSARKVWFIVLPALRGQLSLAVVIGTLAT